MGKLSNFGTELILVTAFFFYEYMFRGFKVLIKDEKLTLFPDSLYKIIFKPFRRSGIAYRSTRQKLMAYGGVFLSGSLFSMLLFLFFFSL
jgi:hypothetical protein